MDDEDNGPNGLLNAPRFVQEELALVNGVWHLPIRIDVDAVGIYAIELYLHDASDDIDVPLFEPSVFFTFEIDPLIEDEIDDTIVLQLADGVDVFAGERITAVLIGDTGANEHNSSEMSNPLILDVTPPRIVDVVLDGSDWADETLTYSYADIVPTGMQLAPIYTQGVETIQIVFSEHVIRDDGLPLDGSEFVLFGSGITTEPEESIIVVVIPHDQDQFVYDQDTRTATLTFESPLGADKYRLEVSMAVTDVAGNDLDGEWDNLTNGTPDDFTGDPVTPGNTFPSGNGTAGAPMNKFQFFFSLLPGDSNQDGEVTSADTSGTIADVNGDGFRDQADVDLIDGTVGPGLIGTRLPVSRGKGDYQDDEIVDQSDYKLWKLTYPLTPTDLRAYGSGDGEIGAGDYSPWRNNLYDYSAWYEGNLPGASGASVPIVQFGVAPQVINVVVSGSQSEHDMYSFDAVVGSGDQLMTVPVGLADTIAIQFSEDVNISADMLQFVGLYTGNRPALAEFTYDLLTQTATWRFDGIMTGDQYVIALSDEITDVEGDRLDGEWTNPASIFTVNSAVSEFPSGDGTGGGDFNFVITLLAGDATQNNIFDGTDTDIFMESWMEQLIDALFTDGDANGDGYVDSGDWYFMADFGLNLQDVFILADLNGDFVVDDADVDILYDNWHDELPNPTQADGDLDGDGDIDIDDFDRLFTQYGLALAVVS